MRAGKFTISAGNTVMPVYTAELYPTAIRNAGVGACNVAAGVALIIVPYISLLVCATPFEMIWIKFNDPKSDNSLFILYKTEQNPAILLDATHFIVQHCWQFCGNFPTWAHAARGHETRREQFSTCRRITARRTVGVKIFKNLIEVFWNALAKNSSISKTKSVDTKRNIQNTGKTKSAMQLLPGRMSFQLKCVRAPITDIGAECAQFHWHFDEFAEIYDKV